MGDLIMDRIEYLVAQLEKSFEQKRFGGGYENGSINSLRTADQ